MPRNNRRRDDSGAEFTTADEARDAMAELHRRAAGDALDDADQERWNAAEAFVERAQSSQQHLRGLAAAQGCTERAGERRTRRDEGADSSYDRSRRMLDSYRSDELPDGVRDRITGAFDEARGRDRTRLADYAAATGDPDYTRAFMQTMIDPIGGHRSWTTDEQRAWQRAAVAQRDLGVGSNGSGASAAVPLILDPAVALTSDGSVNPVRQLASVKSILSNRWQGVSSEGVVNDWTEEAQEVGATDLDFSPPAITTRKYTAFVAYSFELGGDWAQLAHELRNIFRDSVDQQQAVAFARGTGPADGEHAQPEGLVTGLAGTGSQVFAGGGFDRDDLLGLRLAVPPRFRANASVLSSLEIQDAAREFPAIEGSSGDVSLVTEGSPPTFRGWRWYEFSELDADPLVDGADFLIAGDVRAGYKIIDRIGSSIETVQHVFSSDNNRPTGQRGALLWGRVGAGVINSNALRLLSNGTS
ncbi:phage major capsid protein [Streptomyces sp. NPDC097941]|uniref:phage major capsid protein n=1 Tax=Streptomyces sp. NPDC097941 TaxID=3155685 RepID=UPI0033262EBC